MPPRHPLPRLWLMTDERQGEQLWLALARLPRGSGVVVRHYAQADAERRALVERVRRIARQRRLTLVVAGSPRFARAARADGFHSRSAMAGGAGQLRTMSVHGRAELVMAEHAGADLIFVSPVYATASHAGRRPLGRRGLLEIARATHIPVVALGGMTRRRWDRLRGRGLHGWAAIGALTPR